MCLQTSGKVPIIVELRNSFPGSHQSTSCVYPVAVYKIWYNIYANHTHWPCAGYMTGHDNIHALLHGHFFLTVFYS